MGIFQCPRPGLDGLTESTQLLGHNFVNETGSGTGSEIDSDIGIETDRNTGTEIVSNLAAELPSYLASDPTTKS